MYQPKENRYEQLPYRRCGKSGMRLSPLSLGLWHNFGGIGTRENARALVRTAFDSGITHFDLANNYGPPPGSAEETFGWILAKDLGVFRDELIVSTKAGYTMWPGPYGDWGSRKYLLSSLDQSLKRLDMEYVDIFYHHRPDPETPLEETMTALDHAVRSGKALYAGISNYPAPLAREAIHILRQLGTPCLIHQPRYSMFDRRAEKDGLLKVLAEEGVGSIAFSPLEQGILTDRYLEGIPADSRAASQAIFLKPEQITDAKLDKVRRLSAIAKNRGQNMSQLALSWVLREQGEAVAADGSKRVIQVSSALVGASKPEQILDNIQASHKTAFTAEELGAIEDILGS